MKLTFRAPEISGGATNTLKWDPKYCEEKNDEYGLYIDYYFGIPEYGQACAHFDDMLSMDEGMFDGGAHDAMQMVLQRKMTVTLIREYHKMTKDHFSSPGYTEKYQNQLKKAEGKLLVFKSEKVDDGKIQSYLTDPKNSAACSR